MQCLNQDSISLLSSGQVISCVNDAIKELIENSLDAGAKTVKIKLEDQGLKTLSVADDGSGITPAGRESVAERYTTSKISGFEDLTNELTTFGFRGEALHAIACVSDLKIITRHVSESNAIEMVFRSDGTIQSKKTVTASVGTTVVAANILNCFPVRIREERANFNIENLKTLLAKYYLAYPSVRFVIDAPPFLTTTRPPLSNLSQAVSCEFGSQVVHCMVERSAECFFKDIRIRMTGLVPGIKSDWKHSSTSRLQIRQYLFVNGRPVKNSTIEKAVNEKFWVIFGSVPKRFPRFVICIDFFRETQLSSSLIDVNTDVAKSAVIFGDNQTIIRLLDRFLEQEPSVNKYHPINEWPSTEAPLINEVSTQDIRMYGSYTWNEIGKFDDYTMFHVFNKTEKSIMAVSMPNLFEAIGVSSAEISRTPNSELIKLYWDQIMDLQGSGSKRVSHILKL